MSTYNLAIVFATRGLSATEFRVLARLADQDNGEAMTCSLSQLADKTEMPHERLLSTLQRVLPRVCLPGTFHVDAAGVHIDADGFRWAEEK